MNFQRQPASLKSLLWATVLLLIPLAVQAGPIGVDVITRGEITEIGKDLVLEIRITPAAGETLAAGNVTVETETSRDFLGTPYPLRALDPEGRTAVFEWAAPVLAEVEPGQADLILKVSAGLPGGGIETGTWSGTFEVGFGEEWSADRITDFIARRGLLPFLAVVFGFGLLMSLSPCIYPMIPITLAVIGAQSQEKGAWHGLVMSVTYVIGMALVYAILGALSATVFSGITAFMQSPTVLVLMALLLLALSFSMFGAFELQAPAFLRDRLGGPGGGKSGLVGTFAMGMVAGLVASPCVGPFLAALLVWVATTGNWVLGFTSLFTFGMGMGLLLIGVGTFPAMLGSMPQSGGWMESVKKGMGLLLVAMAFYFVRPELVMPEKYFYPLVGVVVILTAVFMGAFDSMPPGAHWWDRTRKGLGLVAFVAGLFLLGGSFVRYNLLMPAAHDVISGSPANAVAMIDSRDNPSTTIVDNPGPQPGHVLPEKVSWEIIHTGEGVQAFLDGKMAEAKATGRPVMIDFWAQWCVYCKKLDKAVWNVPEVVAEAQRFVTIKVDATAPDDEEMTAIKEYFKVPGLPRVIFIDSRGEVLHGRTAGFKPAGEMLAVMKDIR